MNKINFLQWFGKRKKINVVISYGQLIITDISLKKDIPEENFNIEDLQYICQMNS